MAETIRDLVIRIKVDQQQVQLKAPDLRPAKAAVEEFEETIASAVEEERKLPAALEESAREFEESRRKIQDSALKAGDAFKQAGEGAFTLARGIAFVSSSSDEDLQKMVQTIAQVQGAFDLFRGTIDTVKGVTEGVRAMRAAQEAAKISATGMAAANTGLAATNTAVAVTGTAASAAMAPLLPILIPIGLALAAVAGAFLLFRDGAEEVDLATDSLEKQRDTLRDIRGELDEIRAAREQTLRLEDLALKVSGEKFDAHKRDHDLRKQSLELERRAGEEGIEHDLTQQDRFRLAREITGPLFGREGVEESMQVQVQLAEQQQALLEGVRDIEEERLDVTLREVQAQQEKIRLAEQELQVINDQVRAADEKVKAAQQEATDIRTRIGLLSAEEQLELKRIAEKQQRDPDSLTIAERQRLAQLAPTDRTRAGLQAAGLQQFEQLDPTGAIADALGIDERADEARRQADAMREFREDEEAAIEEQIEEAERVRDITKRHAETLLNNIRSLNDLQETVIDELLELRRDLEEYKTLAQQRA